MEQEKFRILSFDDSIAQNNPVQSGTEQYRVENIPQQKVEYEPEGFFGATKRNLARSATNIPAILDIPESIGGLLQAPIGRPESMSLEDINNLNIPDALKNRLRDAHKSYNAPGVVGQLREKVLPEEWREPRGGWEQVLDNVVGSVPMYAALGGPAATLAWNVVGGAAGESVEKLLKDAGTSDVTAKGGNLATQWILGGISKMNPKNFISKVQRTINDNYRNANKLFGTVKAPESMVKTIRAEIRDFAKEFEYKSDINQKVIKHLAEGESVLSSNKVKMSDLMKLKKDWSKEAYRAKTHPDIKNALRRINYKVKSALNEFGEKNPAFKNTYGKAEDLTGAIRDFESAIKNIAETGNLKSALDGVVKRGAIGTIARSPLKIPELLLGNYARTLTPYGKFLFKSPQELSKVLLDGMVDSIVKGKGSLANSIVNFKNGVPY